MLIGYIRVSTNDQNTDLQRNALMCAGCEQIFEDKMSGTKSERPGLKRALKCLKRGDTLVVWKLDRLGRRMKHLIALTEELRAKRCQFSQSDGFNRYQHSDGKVLFSYDGCTGRNGA